MASFVKNIAGLIIRAIHNPALHGRNGLPETRRDGEEHVRYGKGDDGHDRRSAWLGWRSRDRGPAKGLLRHVANGA